MAMSLKKRHNKPPQKTGRLQRIQSQLTGIVDKNDDKVATDTIARLHDSVLRGGRVVRQRKQMRKDMRKLKKAKRAAYYNGKQMPSLDDMKKPLAKKKRKKKKKVQKEKAEEMSEDEEDLDELPDKAEKLELANAADKKIIRELEKKMKMKKKKSLPKAFGDEGLDYLLDVIGSYGRLNAEGNPDSGSSAAEISNYKDVADSDPDEINSDEFDDDEEDENDIDNEDNDYDEDDDYEFTDISDDEEATPVEYTVEMDTSDLPLHKSILKSDKQKDGSENYEQQLEGGNVPNKSLDARGRSFLNDKRVSFESKSDQEHDENDKIHPKKSNKKRRKPADNPEVTDDVSMSERGADLHEDIYGRLRDASGKVVADSSSYVPPAKCLLLTNRDEDSEAELARLRKHLRGLINRISESSMHSISARIEQIYRENSRADVNRALTDTIFDAAITASMLPERLSAEIVMLVAVLHSNVGCEIGAYFVQTLAKRFDDLYSVGNTTGKQLDNCLVMLAHLVNFQVVHSCLVFDVLHKLIDSFSEKDIDLILVIMKNAGFTLRKDDPQALKAAIAKIQTRAVSVDTSTFTDASRVRFMIDVLLAIRNNNLRKIPNYDTSHIDHLRKNIHTYITGSRGDSQLSIHYDELLKTEEHGRWWIVGSAWSGAPVGPKSDATPTPPPDSATGKVLALATKQRMNTDIRRNIFCVVMTADDYVDAYEKLLRLGLQHKQEREIIFVVVDCCLQEKTFNPFYAYVLQKICHHDRRFQMTMQFHVWDKFKCLSDMTDINRTNLSNLLSHLIATKSLPLSVLKVIEFGTLVKEMARVLRTLFTKLLLDHQESTIREIFERAAVQPKLRQFSTGLRLFLRHFMLEGEESGDDLLRERVALACDVLSSANSKISL